MNLFYDNIVFALQTSGGISVYWKELITRIQKDSDFTLNFFEYDNQNVFRREIEIPENQIMKNQFSMIPVKFGRYLNMKLQNQEGLFHSSYYRVASGSGLNNITTVHDFTYEFFVKGIQKLIHHTQKGIAIRKSDGIICVSENTKKDLLSLFPEIDESKIRVIYNGVNQGYRVLSADDKIQSDLKIPFREGEFILYIGDRVSKYKNFRLAVETCGLLRMPLLIVGGKPLSPVEKELLTKELGAKNFLPILNVSIETLNIIYNKALCLLYPSSYEGFGIPIIEAQKAGCPVICNNGSSIPEVAGDGAFLIDKADSHVYADAVRQILADSSLKNDFISKGLGNSTRFSWDDTFRQTKNFYNDIYFA